MKKAIVWILAITLLSSCIRYTPMQQSWQPKNYKKMTGKTPKAYRAQRN